MNLIIVVLMALSFPRAHAATIDSDEQLLSVLCGAAPIRISGGMTGPGNLACAGCPFGKNPHHDSHSMLWERIPGSYTSDMPQVMTMMWGCGGWEENYLVLLTWMGSGWRREFNIPHIGFQCHKLAKTGKRDALICDSAESTGGVERQGYVLLTFPKDRLERESLLDGFWTYGNENVVRDPTACSTILPAALYDDPERPDSFRIVTVSSGSAQTPDACKHSGFLFERQHHRLDFTFDGTSAVLSTSSAADWSAVLVELARSPKGPSIDTAPIKR